MKMEKMEIKKERSHQAGGEEPITHRTNVAPSGGAAGGKISTV